MRQLVYTADDENDTDRLGRALAQCLPDTATVALCGTLGAGKTRLVQAVAVALGVPRAEVTSPTFVLCQHYRGRRTIHHLDAYRIHDDDEFISLGVDEYFFAASDDVRTPFPITFVEWADRVAACLPPDYLEITVQIEPGGEMSRTFLIRSCGRTYDQVLPALAERLKE